MPAGRMHRIRCGVITQYQEEEEEEEDKSVQHRRRQRAEERRGSRSVCRARVSNGAAAAICGTPTYPASQPRCI